MDESGEGKEGRIKRRGTRQRMLKIRREGKRREREVRREQKAKTNERHN